MPIFNIYSKRKKAKEKSGVADVYVYDIIPEPLRVQIVHIWHDAIGITSTYGPPQIHQRWAYIHNTMAREKGVFKLYSNSGSYGDDEQCIRWFLEKAITEDALDIIELSFRVIDRLINDWERQSQGLTMNAEEAINELNHRFQEHGVGYQYEDGEIIRIDSQYIHAEITKPALTLISDARFDAARDEFLTAHRQFRNKEYKDSIVGCQRSFESVLRTICVLKGWSTKKADRLPELITTVRKNGLLPDYLDSGLDTYIALLKTGLPGVRNNAGGHGHATGSPPVPEYIASFALHTTATNIVLVMSAFQSP